MSVSKFDLLNRVAMLVVVFTPTPTRINGKPKYKQIWTAVLALLGIISKA